MTTLADRDVVYIVKASENNPELLHSLRSVAANLPHRRVWLVGYRPRWVGPEVGYVPTIQRGPKHSNTWNNWVAAARHPDISDEFTLFNDDFFVTRPVEDVPALHRGPLGEMIEWYARNRLASHRQRAAVTRRALQMAGHGEPLHSYELHTPMVINRHILAEGVKWLSSSRSTDGVNISKRTFYGNLAGIGGERSPDVKVVKGSDGVPEVRLPFVSTSPASWAGLAGGWIRQLFPDVGRYERVPSDHLYQPPSVKEAARARR
jgi:hypothetical protein